MTKQQAIDKILALAESWRELRRHVVDVYNSYQPHPRGYEVKESDPLCAAYVSALFIALGWTKLVPPECGAMQLARNMNALDRFVDRSDHVPAPGDLIFFDWQGDGWADHVGLVTGVKGDLITYSDIPAYSVTVCRVFSRDSSILGYGVPDYAAAPEPETESAPETFRPGDLVRVREGAKWYNGAEIPDFVRERAWRVIEVIGGRAVLGMDEQGLYNIQSPIRAEDLEPAGSPSPQPEETVEITVTLKKETWERWRESGRTVEAILEEALA